MSQMVSAVTPVSGPARAPADYFAVEVNDEVIRKVYQNKSEKKKEPRKVEPVVAVKKPEQRQQIRPSHTALLAPDGFSQPTLMGADFNLLLPVSETGPSGPPQLTMVSRVEPVYPTEARLRQIEGTVTVQFQVDSSGHVSSVEVLESNPKRVFERSAINAVRKWKFPKGMGYEGSLQQVTLEFKLDT
jgi:protein TonB